MPRDNDDDNDGGKEVSKDETIFDKALKYCWGHEFLDVFRAYFRKHAYKFEAIAEGKTEEHDLNFQTLFQEYLELFEGSLEKFIEREGSDIHTFYAEVRRKQTSQDPNVKLFVQCLLASADYDSFFNVMRKEAQRQLEQQQHAGDAAGAGAIANRPAAMADNADGGGDGTGGGGGGGGGGNRRSSPNGSEERVGGGGGRWGCGEAQWAHK